MRFFHPRPCLLVLFFTFSISFQTKTYFPVPATQLFVFVTRFHSSYVNYSFHLFLVLYFKERAEGT
jgi:hypothetical protein